MWMLSDHTLHTKAVHCAFVYIVDDFLYNVYFKTKDINQIRIVLC